MVKKIELSDEEKHGIFIGHALINAKYDDETHECFYDYEYEGFLTDYFETGMEGISTLVQEDKPIAEGKYSLQNAVFLKGGEYLIVYENDEIIYQNMLIPSLEQFEKSLHLLPTDVSYEDWFKWMRGRYKVRVFTNFPTLEDSEND